MNLQQSDSTTRSERTIPFQRSSARSESLRSLLDKRAGVVLPSADTEKMATQILRLFSIPAHLRGYWYLRTAILLTVEDPERVHLITKELYPDVASIHRVNVATVERNIRHALQSSWANCDLDAVEFFFVTSPRNKRGRPSCGEFIACIADMIRQIKQDDAYA